jgi:hypothetical protein
MVGIFDPSIFDDALFDVSTIAAPTDSLLRQILTEMETKNVGLYIWQVGLWEPGMWEQNTLLRINLKEMEK